MWGSSILTECHTSRRENRALEERSPEAGRRENQEERNQSMRKLTKEGTGRGWDIVLHVVAALPCLNIIKPETVFLMKIIPCEDSQSDQDIKHK